MAVFFLFFFLQRYGEINLVKISFFVGSIDFLINVWFYVLLYANSRYTLQPLLALLSHSQKSVLLVVTAAIATTTSVRRNEFLESTVRHLTPIKCHRNTYRRLRRGRGGKGKLIF